MRKMLLILFGICLLLAAPLAMAQDNRVEISASAGYSLSNGIDVDPVEYEDVTYDRITPASGFSFDIQGDFFLTEGFSLGFNWGRQEGELKARGVQAADRKFADMDVNNFHGIFTYNFGGEDEEIRPYLFGGLGATHYDPGDIEGNPSNSLTRFSTTWGGGVKIFASEHFGFKGGVRWTPTYVTTTDSGLWCDPWYPWYCWYSGNDQFSHQFEFSGGIIARF
ncbi:MAG: outer membrane beta-barrel protein [Acidobacteriota bacterium]